MVSCGVKEMQELDGLEVEIDLEVGLEPSDIDFVVAFLSDAEAFTDKVVPVHIYGPSTTNRALLGELARAIANRLRELGKEPAVNVHA